MTPSMNSRDLLVSREKPTTGGVVKPLAIDLCCGLGGWTEGLLSEGWRVRGYDIEAHEYGEERYPTELVLKSILDLHGSELADADLIVASPPCQEFSYMAMPWTRAKQIARALRGKDEFPPGYKGSRTLAELTALFDACFRLQREASEAAGRQIPMVVENVKGAQPWVGPAPWSFGSYFLWGDIPALMPAAVKAQKFNPDGTGHPPGSWFAIADSKDRGSKNAGGSWFAIGSPGQKQTNRNPVHALTAEGMKGGSGSWFNDYKSRAEKPTALLSMTSSKSPARKRASAQIAKIPLALSSWVARVYRPDSARAAA